MSEELPVALVGADVADDVDLRVGAGLEVDVAGAGGDGELRGAADGEGLVEGGVCGEGCRGGEGEGAGRMVRSFI